MFQKIIVFLIGLMIILSGCSNLETKSQRSIEGNDYVLGTIVFINILDHGSEELLESCFKRLDEIEAEMSVNIESSDISQLNDYIENQVVSEDTFYVIEKGLYYGDLSNGAFDITLGPIINLWKIGTDEANVPSKSAIEEALSYVDYQSVVLNEEKRTITIQPNMAMDLGGIAKGYAADEVEKILKEAGVKSAIINLGGNIKVVGSKEENVPFKVGIQGPEASRNDYIGIVSVKDKTVVTSGDYERYFIEDGVRYHHIFDTRTGYPYETNVASVTVITDRSIDADALSTILYVTPINEGISLVHTLDGVDCVYVTKDKKIVISEGVAEMNFTISDTDYTLENN